MISLSFIFWLTLIAALFAFWWRSDQVKSFAIIHTLQYCRANNLQLLDQTMVLRGLWPIRAAEGHLGLRRTKCWHERLYDTCHQLHDRAI